MLMDQRTNPRKAPLPPEFRHSLNFGLTIVPAGLFFPLKKLYQILKFTWKT